MKMKTKLKTRILWVERGKIVLLICQSGSDWDILIGVLESVYAHIIQLETDDQSVIRSTERIGEDLHVKLPKQSGNSEITRTNEITTQF